MKISSRNIGLYLVLIFTGQSIFAQTDSIARGKSALNYDSLKAVRLEEYYKKLAEIKQQHLADSIARVDLEAQINALKTTDKLKQEELQKQLQALEEKEAIRRAEKKARIDSLKLTTVGFPVLGFFEDTLLLIYNRIGSVQAKERAEAITKNIKPLAKVYRFSPDSLKIFKGDPLTDILFKGKIIMSISENDAIWNNSTQAALAEKYRKIISDEVLLYQSETSVAVLAKEIGLAFLVIVVTWIVIVLINRLHRWTKRKIHEIEGKVLKGLNINNYTLIDSRREVNILLTINGITRWFLILLVIYIALPLFFGIFPWTEKFAETLFGYILNPLRKIANAFVSYLPNLVTIIIIVVVFRYILKGIHFLKREIENGELKLAGFYPDWANPTYQIIRVLIFAFMIVVIFPYLPGSDSPVFKGVSVFLGFLFTFGSAGSLSNIIAGFVLTYMRLFKIGDRVKFGDVLGDVVEKSMLVTRIRTPKNEIISIPNSTIMNNHTINYSSDAPDKGLIIHTTVTIGYDVPWRDMHQALIEAAERTELILKEPKPYVLQTSLDDFYVSYQINAFIREANKQLSIYSELHQNIQDVCNEKGIEIMSPHYRSLRDGNTTSIPSGYLSKDYKKPGFDVFVKKENGNPGASE